MDTAGCHHPVDSATSAKHWRALLPDPGSGVVHLHCIGLRAGETAFETATDDIQLPIDHRSSQMIPLRREVGQSLPLIGHGIVDGKVSAAGRTTARHVDL